MNRDDIKAINERLYKAYRQDRDDGISHAQIVADGVYGAEVEAFALRYSLAVAAYADAMRAPRDGPQYSTDGRLIGSEYVAPIPERKSQP